MEIENGVNFLEILPEECLSIITSFTTPVDACRLALVSKDMLSPSESDVVWKRFLPSDIDLIVSRSDEQEASLSRKQLYKRLTNDPLLVDQSSKNFLAGMFDRKEMLDDRCEEPLYHLGRNTSVLEMVSHCWIMNLHRFPEAAELLRVWWFYVSATIQTSMLSPSTHYEAHLVFSINENAVGFDQLFKGEVSTAGTGVKVTKPVYLGVGPTRQRREGRTPARRADGWWEVMIGEFYSYDPGEECDELELSVREIENLDYKTGIIIDGIELRPASRL